MMVKASEALNRHQRRVLETLETFIEANGYVPSYLELCRVLGLRSLATVHKHIKNLERKGWLARMRNSKRCLTILRKIPPRAFVQCPHCHNAFEFSIKEHNASS